ncbi:MAG: hypothetical protein CVV23_08355 [Ignavibacteriae bacterium HGW-Ignavibacteriae-2]|jgi:hypothetical protein|nr:MAG: hypothetical protein CVV23_08355 [Ignavibacteriae bacterium HGW-Ignavibacteriae-2]
MKTGQIFWGVLFVTIGSLILLQRYDIFIMDWSFVWDLWPVLLILWGLSIITKETFVKPIITVLIAFFIGAVLYGSVSNIVDGSNNVLWQNDDYDVRTFYEDYYENIKFADLKLSAGVGTFTIKDRTSRLIKGIAQGNIGEYTFNTYNNDDNTNINVEMNEADFNPFKNKTRNRLELQLNENTIWNLDLNLGAAKAYFDLTPFKVQNLSLKTGATKTKIKLGKEYNNTDVNIEMGAATLDIAVPKEAGCRLKGDMVLIIKDLKGFSKLDSGYYETDNFDSAAQKITINVNGGVSALDINRY